MIFALPPRPPFVALLLLLGLLAVTAESFVKVDARTIKKELKANLGRGPRVAIIGAGMAGLSAAKRLHELGIRDVTIFEALDRVGGRIHSVEYFGGYLQHGAQYINGDANPIYKIASGLGVVSGVFGDLEHLDNPRFLQGDCDVEESDIELWRKFTKPLDPLYRKIAREETSSRRYSIYDVYQADYLHFLRENNVTSFRRRAAFDALSLIFRSYWEFEWASDWKDQSLRNLADFNDKGPIGESYSTDKIGYKAIIDHIRLGMGNARLALNSPVVNIRYDDPEHVWVTTETKYGTHKSAFDYVISTVSLGHLKKYHKTLFTPPVGRFTKKVIEKIGFGGSTKVFLRWKNPFWKEDDKSLATLSVKGCNGNDDSVDPFESEITTMQPLDWEPNTLILWIAGRGQKIFDNMEDDEVAARTTNFIRKLMKNSTIEGPELVTRSRLTKNEYLLGSYSYISIGQARERILHSDLSIPLKFGGRPRVLFAGEATHHRLFETAIGAYLSGRREVDRLAADWTIAAAGHARGRPP